MIFIKNSVFGVLFLRFNYSAAGDIDIVKSAVISLQRSISLFGDVCWILLIDDY